MFSLATRVTNRSRAMVLAGIAALALTSVAPTTSFARVPEKGTATVGKSDTTDISSRRRAYRGNGGAAAAAAFAGIVGTGIAIAAANSRPYGYYDGYYGRPAYYGGGYGYGGPAYYGNGYYGGGGYGYGGFRKW